MTTVKELHDRLLHTYDKIMYLKFFVEDFGSLREYYEDYVNKHNNKVLNNAFIDSGFDLFLPENEDEEKNLYGEKIHFFGKGWEDVSPLNKVNFKVKCFAQIICDTGKQYNTGFYVYPRSSLSKTPLRLANSVGIIDAGYRNNLIGLFDVIDDEDGIPEEADYLASPYTRLLQICAPGLVPIFVELVNNEEDLGVPTERGLGGIGSTGV
jgi:dUTP pyrophosphatase